MYKPKLRWHFGIKCGCHLTFIFVFKNVTWHFGFEVEHQMKFVKRRHWSSPSILLSSGRPAKTHTTYVKPHDLRRAVTLELHLQLSLFALNPTLAPTLSQQQQAPPNNHDKGSFAWPTLPASRAYCIPYTTCQTPKEWLILSSLVLLVQSCTVTNSMKKHHLSLGLLQNCTHSDLWIYCERNLNLICR